MFLLHADDRLGPTREKTETGVAGTLDPRSGVVLEDPQNSEAPSEL